MNLLKEFEDDLKMKQCHWQVYGSSAAVCFDGELKEIVSDDFLEVLSVKIGSPKKKKADGPLISIKEPVDIQKEDDEAQTKYTIFSDGEPILITGYPKVT